MDLSETIRIKVEELRRAERLAFENNIREINTEINHKNKVSKVLHSRFEAAVKAYQKLLDSRRDKLLSTHLNPELLPSLAYLDETSKDSSHIKTAKLFRGNATDSNLNIQKESIIQIDEHQNESENQKNDSINSISSYISGDSVDSTFNEANAFNSNQEQNDSLAESRVVSNFSNATITPKLINEAIRSIRSSLDNKEKIAMSVEDVRKLCNSLKEDYSVMEKSISDSHRRLALARYDFHNNLKSFDKLENSLLQVSNSFERTQKNRVEANFDEILNERNRDFSTFSTLHGSPVKVNLKKPEVTITVDPPKDTVEPVKPTSSNSKHVDGPCAGVNLNNVDEKITSFRSFSKDRPNIKSPPEIKALQKRKLDEIESPQTTPPPNEINFPHHNNPDFVNPNTISDGANERVVRNNFGIGAYNAVIALLPLSVAVAAFMYGTL